MRIADEIIHPEYKITVFEHNKKIILQIESDMLTQTFKFREAELLQSGKELRRYLDSDFFYKVAEQFVEMQKTHKKIQLNFTPSGFPDFPSVI